MSTILESVSALISANLRALVDQVIQSNNLAVVDEYVRQGDAQVEALEEAAVTVGGQVRSLRRRMDAQMRQSNDLDRAVNAALAAGREGEAAEAQAQLNSTRLLLNAYQEQLERQEEEVQKLLAARTRLQARLDLMKMQRGELQALLDLARSKNLVAKRIKSLDGLLGSGDSDISRMVNNLYAQMDEADNIIDLRPINPNDERYDLLEQKLIENQLAERKKRLSAKGP